jgi:hypothetical protein
VLGLPPITLLRRKRLGDVHATLLMGAPDVTVREIAIENGFAKLGRFAASYRRLFGQLTVAHFAAVYRTVAISQEVHRCRARWTGHMEKIFAGVGSLPTGSSSGQSGRPIATSLERAMRYLCLVYGTEDSLPVMQNTNPMSRAEVDALTRDSLAYNDVLRTSGHFIVAHALQSVRTATTVRVRSGRVLVTDGPFAETKEQLLGFVLIEAKDHDDAVEVASRIPLARLGSIEVRSIMDLARTGLS